MTTKTTNRLRERLNELVPELNRQDTPQLNHLLKALGEIEDRDSCAYYFRLDTKGWLSRDRGENPLEMVCRLNIIKDVLSQSLETQEKLLEILK